MKTVSLTLLLSLVLAVSVGFSQQEKLKPALDSLVAAERAFAALSVDKGIRESFITFIADDGIGFDPHPIKLRELYLKRPAPATKPPVTLNWQPVYADISQAGDLGYTTGPYTFTDQSPQKRPPHYGFYFSIWKKQADGSWKVALDCGIDTPNHSQEKFEFKPARLKSKSISTKVDLENERLGLMNLDRDFLKAANAGGVVNAYVSYLADETRLHRNNIFPVIGKEPARALIAQQISRFTWAPISSDVSQSDDLGYAYGSYELTYRDDKRTEKGYYVRVWKRDGSGKWKLVLETLSPIPPETK